jgi:hypothetical protein
MTQPSKPETNPERKWHRRDTADFLGISEQTLANWAYRGCGPPYEKYNNGAVRYDPPTVRKWAADQTRTSTSESRPL